MQSWVLIMSLYFMQQATHTDVRVEHLPPVVGIESSDLCEAGKKAWVDDNQDVAVEPTDDYEAPDNDPKAAQPRKDRWELVTPVATCVRVR